MRKINWITALFLVSMPVLAVVWGWSHISTHGVRLGEVLLFVTFLSASGIGITAGYHRLFAHGAYEASRPLKVFYLLFGAAAMQNSVLWWSAEHRRHHKNLDHEADPYNIREGFLWAHIGWLIWQKPVDLSNVKDLAADPLIRWQHTLYYPLAITMAFGLPLAIGWAVGNPWGFLLWGGVFRIVALHHSTFFVNSLAHTLGSRRYDRAISARDSFVTALLTFGEGYHNFHHAFANDYRNGLRWYHWDPTKWWIGTWAALGHAWDLYRAPRERIVAAEVACATETLLERARGRSEAAVSYVRDRVAELAPSFQAAAQRLGDLEREMARLRRSWGSESRRRTAWLREEMRTARREFRAARSRWRVAIDDLRRQRVQQTA